MSSLSPRAGITLMADGDFIDATVISNNAQKLDALTSITPCTSTSRPTAPFDGQLIYETDHQTIRRYDATAKAWFLRVGSGNYSPKGLIGSFSSTAAALTGPGPGPVPLGTNPYGSPISLLDYSFSVKANYFYRVIEQGFYEETGTFNTTNNRGSNDIMELYTIFGANTNPGLVSSYPYGVHYIRDNYQSQENGQRRPYFKNMPLVTNFTGTLYMRSLMRSSVQNAGRPADTIGAYAWVYELGPTGTSL